MGAEFFWEKERGTWLRVAAVHPALYIVLVALT